MTSLLTRRLTGAVNRPRAALAVLLTTLVVVLVPPTAEAHSLDSSIISTHVTDDGVDATITIALQMLDEAMGTDHAAEQDVSSYADEVQD